MISAGRLLFCAIPLAVFLFTACMTDYRETEASPPEGADIIEKNKFIQLLIDIELTEANLNFLITQDKAGSEHVFTTYKSIFEKHNVTSEEFKATLTAYSSRRVLFNQIYQSVLDTLEIRARDLRK
jgi:hypothetical protein